MMETRLVVRRSICTAHGPTIIVGLFAGWLAPVSLALAQTPGPSVAKEARATRLATGTIRIDGRLDEEIWQRAAPLTGFTQAEPNEGEPPQDGMDVRFVYDDTALYVGARLMSGSSGVQAPMSRRDDGEQAERIWGLNVKRWRPQLNEQDYWIVIGRTERGWASRFGVLRGIEGLQSKSRLEVMPYVAGSTTMTANPGADNPFDDGFVQAGHVGVDAKVGVGPNLTLDVTVNPDFGQIEADPAEVNLTVFGRLHGESADHVPRDAAGPALSGVLDDPGTEQHVVLRHRPRLSQLAVEQQ